MMINFITLGGYGLFVWPAFLFTFASCFYLYINSKKELEMLEAEYFKEFKQNQKVEIYKEPRKEILSVSSI